jgi:hypothetical protein
VSDTHVDELRAALRREAQHIEPVGLGVETIQRRGRHRRNRGRAIVAVGAVTCVAGLGVSVIHRQGPPAHSVAVAANAGSGSPPPALAFRVVTGTVSYSSNHFTTPGGVTYALSTAPGVAGPADAQSQAIYRTTDGEHWTAADQSSDWITDLSQSDGVLYAVGTAPGAATPADVRYRVATSHDDGNAWTDTDLPFDLTTPSAKVPISRYSSVQIASAPGETVALLSEQFSPDLSGLIAARTAGHPNVSTEMTADGYVMRDLSACMADKKNLARAAAGADPVTPKGLSGKCADPPALGTISWAEVGISGAAELTHEEMLVSTDGSHWSAVPAPGTGSVRDLAAYDGGFLLLADKDVPAVGNEGPGVETTLLRSSDAQHWTPVATPAGLNVQAIAGDRVLGVDASGVMQTSADGGTTWNATDLASELPAGSPAASVSATDVGPLGFAVVATADANPNDSNAGTSYLLFSTDGISWSATDLATVGATAGASPMQVTVGSDHIGIDYEPIAATGAVPVPMTTLLATPKR